MTEDLDLNPGLSRRRLLQYGAGGLAVLAAAPLLAACGDSGSKTAGNRVMNWIPDPRPEAAASSRWWYEAFEKANPGVKAELLNVPYGDDTTKLKAGNSTGDVPDVIWAYGDFLYTYGVDGLVAPVTDIVNSVGRDKFLPATIDGIEIGGDIFSVPFVGFPFFIYYRKDLYKEKGLRVPTTHDELLYNIEKLHDSPRTFGYVLTNQAISDTWNLKCAMWTHGAYFFDENEELALDRPETVAAWDFYKKLGKYTAPGSMAQSDLQARQLFVDGKAAHMCTTTSLSAQFKKSDLENFGAFKWPGVDGAKGASLDFNGLCIPKRAKSPKLAADEIKFVLEDKNYQEYLKRTVVGWVPMLQTGYTDEYLQSPKISLIREFVELGQEVAAGGVVGTGYFGPTKKSSALVSTNVEKQIGDRLVVKKTPTDEVLDYAIDAINKAL